MSHLLCLGCLRLHVAHHSLVYTKKGFHSMAKLTLSPLANPQQTLDYPRGQARWVGQVVVWRGCLIQGYSHTLICSAPSRIFALRLSVSVLRAPHPFLPHSSPRVTLAQIYPGCKLAGHIGRNHLHHRPRVALACPTPRPVQPAGSGCFYPESRQRLAKHGGGGSAGTAHPPN